MNQQNNLILEVLVPLKPLDIFLFGSRARKNSKETSDYDIMVFWRKSNFPQYKYESYDCFSSRMFEVSVRKCHKGTSSS